MPHISLNAAASGAPGRLTRRDAAAYLGVSVSTMADWHRRGLGPASMMVGGRRYYRLEALTAFIQQNEGRTGC